MARHTNYEGYIYTGILNILGVSWEVRTDKNNYYKEGYTRINQIIRKHMEDADWNHTHNAYTEIQLRLRSGKC